jgi:hypothetical protein
VGSGFESRGVCHDSFLSLFRREPLGKVLPVVSSNAATVSEYLASLTPERRQTISEVRTLVKQNLPAGFNEVMNWVMIAYEIPISFSGRTYNGQPYLWAAIASQKNYCSLYLTGLYSDQAELDEFQSEWSSQGKKLNMGKSCIRFRKVDDLALDLVAKTLKSRTLEEALELITAARASGGRAR